MGTILTSRSNNIALLAEECEVLIANTPELLRECFRLRHQVYCLENNYETVNGSEERDEHDVRARHILLRHRETGESIGTARIVLTSLLESLDGLPMSKAAPGRLGHLPAWSTGEVSRFALSKQRRLSCGASAMIRLGLVQGLVRLSAELGLTHWAAIMEPILLRLLRTDGIHFDQLGPLVEYHGMRQPSCCDVNAVIERMRADHGDIWNYVTEGGALWPAQGWDSQDAANCDFPIAKAA